MQKTSHQSRSLKVFGPSLALTGLLAAVLSSCGGGDSPAPEVVPPIVAADPLAPAGPIALEQALALYGIGSDGVGGDSNGDGGAAGAAGEGAPFKNAVVTLTDATGNQVTGQTDSNGKYLLKYQTKNFTAPLVYHFLQ